MRSFFYDLFHPKEKEIAALNGLRALAILMVLLHHFTSVAERALKPGIWLNLFERFTAGVDLFFILSGFLISWGLKQEWERNKSISFRSFYLKRTLRIFPAYYFYLLVSYFLLKMQLVTVLQAPVTEERQVVSRMIIDNLASFRYDLFYLGNYFGSSSVHLWSLAVEEQFYLVFPLLCWALLFRLNKQPRVVFLIAMLFATLVMRWLVFVSHDTWSYDLYEFIYRATHLRQDTLIAGILLMEFYTSDLFKNRKLFLKYEKYLLPIAVGTLAIYLSSDIGKFSLYRNVFSYTQIYLGFGVIFFFALIDGSFTERIFRPIFWTPIARLSYTMYLWHMVVGLFAITAIFGANPPESITILQLVFVFLVGFFASMLVSLLLHLAVEYPFLVLKSRLTAASRASSKNASLAKKNEP